MFRRCLGCVPVVVWCEKKILSIWRIFVNFEHFWRIWGLKAHKSLIYLRRIYRFEIMLASLLFISYNPEPTNSLLLTFGFIEEHVENPNEKITFSVNELLSCMERVHLNKNNSLQRLKDIGLEPNMNSSNPVYISNKQTCSWALQKAALVLLVNNPSDLGVNCKTTLDIYYGNYQKIPKFLRENVEEYLRNLIKDKIICLEDRLESSDLPKILEKLFVIQKNFLQEFLQENEKLFTLISFADCEDGHEVDSRSENSSTTGNCSDDSALGFYQKMKPLPRVKEEKVEIRRVYGDLF